MIPRTISSKIRLSVLKRDNFTCIGCGAKDKRLEIAHYLPAFYEINQDKRDIKYKNSPDNLVALCIVCHRVFDGHRYKYFLVTPEMRAERDAIYQHNYNDHHRGFGYVWEGNEKLAEARLDEIKKLERESCISRRAEICKKVNERLASYSQGEKPIIVAKCDTRQEVGKAVAGGSAFPS
jgi:hypothetical protein